MRIETERQLADSWPQVRGWIAAAIAVGPGDENEWDVFLKIHKGEYDLWHEEELAVVTQVQKHMRQTVLLVVYAGAPEHSGAVKRLHALLAREREGFKAKGITKLRVQGPRDWSPQLETKPFYVAQVDI